MQINSRTRGRLRKESKSHKGMEVVKSHDRLCTEETKHIEEENAKGFVLNFIIYYIQYERNAMFQAKICFKPNLNFEFPYFIALVASEIRIEENK